MKKVAITSEFFGKFSKEAERLLVEAGIEVVHNKFDKFLDKEEEIIEIAKNCDAFICDLEKISKNVIDSAPNLKIISRRGVGVDSVDVAYANEKGIEVGRTLGVVEKPVAELVMGYILNIYREIQTSDKEMKDGRWTKYLGESLDGKVLGIVGFGAIGKELARKAKVFDMKIIYSDVYRLSEELGVEYVTFEELLEKSDVISINAPLMESTYRMFNYETMSKLKKKPILINAARGGIVNEDDLVRALEEGLVGYAAVDVFETEPCTNSELRKFDNVILTPHNATFTRNVFIEMDIKAAINVINCLNK